MNLFRQSAGIILSFFVILFSLSRKDTLSLFVISLVAERRSSHTKGLEVTLGGQNEITSLGLTTELIEWKFD